MMVLAPSSISVKDLLLVAEKLIGRHLHDERMICRFVFGDKEPELLAATVCIDGLATEIVAAYSKHNNNMLSMGSSEPCGVPLLGHSSVILCDLLNKESSTKKFAILMEYSVVTTALPGKKNLLLLQQYFQMDTFFPQLTDYCRQSKLIPQCKKGKVY